MKIKRYLADNMPEALTMIKRDLGPEAVIVSSRKVAAGGWRGFFRPKKLEVTAAVEQDTSKPGPEASGLKEEVEEIKNLIKELQGKTLTGKQQEEIIQGLRNWQELLLKLDINYGLVHELLNDLEVDGDKEGPSLKEILNQRISSIFKEPELNQNRKFYCFVGPTGVGKTTTLAKLAAEAALFQQRNIAIVTIDTYRIGAVDQLKTYAKILNIPLEVVMSPPELKEALAKHGDKDVVFIDTAGRPSVNTAQLVELKQFLEVIPERATFLVLSCTTKSSDLLQIAHDFQITGYNQLIFTKVDETRSLGTILNVVQETGYSVAYLTTGQNVPDDIMTADPTELAKMILGAVE